MLKRTTALSAALFWALAGLALPASAEDGEPVRVGEPDAAAAKDGPKSSPAAVFITEYVTVDVDGKAVEVRARGVGTEAMELDAGPIFDQMNSRFEVRGSILGYWRFQDGAVMGLDFSDGKVRANGFVLGKLPDFPVRETADTWLAPNAIAVLTGTKANFDAASGWHFALDDRLKPKFDLDLWVNGKSINISSGSEPRTLGPVLLVPLRDVCAALGHRLTEDTAAGTVEVTRMHDSAVIKLELSTGLVTVNGVPSGVSPNMSMADKTGLVLPFSAVETLTGSHIVLAPGARRVDVTLDDRLSSLALPGDRVADTAGATPFTLERVDYQLSDRGPLKADFYAHFGKFNAVATIETAGGWETQAGLAPRWMSVDLAAMSGWRGTVGDYSGNLRELSGTSASRIRGISYRTRQESGTIMAIAAGVPLTGAKPLESGASVPEFGGFAGGVRFIKPNGRVEYGASAEISADGQSSRLVAGGSKTFDIINKDEKGLESAHVSGDFGVIQTDGESKFAVRGQAEARYAVSEQLSVSASASHDGAGFNAAANAAEPADRSAATLSLDWHAKADWGVLKNVAGGLRTSAAHTNGPESASSLTQTAGFSTRIGRGGPDVSLDASLSSVDTAAGRSDSRAVSARAWQAFDWGSVTGAWQRTETDGAEADDRFSATAAIPGWKRALGKGAQVALAPSASVVWTQGQTDARLGATASADSGRMLGERFKLNGQFVALTRTEAGGQAQDMFANAGATWRIGRSVELQAAYATDFGKRQDFSISLKGSLGFNEARRHLQPLEGTGVLKGRVFFDRNRDGLRQPDEPGISGARISIVNSRLKLAADPEGNYTIQNIKTGLYTLNIDGRSLPLGMLVAEKETPRATIGDGRVTTLDIPVMASGQVRGAVFLDANANGLADKGEERVEGEWVRLTPLDADKAEDKKQEHVLQSAAFGQYGFENLSPGSYRLEAGAGSRAAAVTVTLTEDSLFHELNLALLPDPKGSAALVSDGLLATP